MSTNNPMSNIPPLGQPTAMMPGAGSSKFKPVDPMRVIRGNWLWIAIGLVIGAGIGFGAWFALNQYAPRYTSKTQFEVQGMRTDTTGQRTSMRIVELEPVILREVASVRSEPTLRETLNSPAVQDTRWFAQFNGDLDAAFKELEENVINAGPVRGAPLINVSATTDIPTDAQIILTALNQEFLRRQSERIENTFARDLQAAQRRRDGAEARISSINGEIKRFLNQNPVQDRTGTSSEADIRARSLVAKVSALTDSYNSIEATNNELIRRQEAANFDPTGEERQQIESDPEIRAINARARELRTARQPLAERLGESHPSVVAFDQQLLLLDREKKSKLDELARVLFEAKLTQAALNRQIIGESLDAARKELAEVRAERQDNVRHQQELSALQRELQQAESERVEAVRSIDQLNELQAAEARVVVRETVPPQQAKKTYPPHPASMCVGMSLLFGGLVTGLVFLRELLDQRVRSAADLKLIPDAALIGTIPSTEEDPGGERKIERVVELHPAGLLAEAFRQVRTAVLSKIDRRGYKTLMVVSAKPGAGVSATAQNLAASCAFSGRRVLLIDANFRRPGLAKLMGMSPQPGLADLLRGDQSIDAISDLAQHSDTDGLDLLPAGDAANAAVELFENPRFRELLARLESEYDLLIIDAPPALLTSDAQLLSRHVDAMLLVSRAQSDTRGMLHRLYRELDGQRADILGVVINGVQSSAGGYLKRNFREFHDYSGPERRTAPRTAVTSAGAAAAVNGSTLATTLEAPASAVMAQEDDDQPDIDVFNEMDDDDDDTLR